MRVIRRGLSVVAIAVAAWFVVAAPASAAAYYVSSTSTVYACGTVSSTGSCTSNVPTFVTSGSFAYSGGTTSCSATKPCIQSTAGFKSNGTSQTGYLVVSYYKNTTSSTTGGTLLGTVTSASFSIPASSTAVYSKSLAYQCKTLYTTTTYYYYYATARFMNSSATYSSDAYPYSGILKVAKGCAT